jgi:hypothetical protein
MPLLPYTHAHENSLYNISVKSSKKIVSDKVKRGIFFTKPFNLLIFLKQPSYNKLVKRCKQQSKLIRLQILLAKNIKLI